MTSHAAQAHATTQTPRIFCIGRNYARHIEELGHAGARECVIFMKPLTALVGSDDDTIAIPTHQGAVHHELELVVEIGRGGCDIAAADAPHHIGGLGLGLDLTLRDMQNELKATGEPWEKCKAFDHSAPLGPMTAFDPATDLTALKFRLDVNGACRQQGHSGMMLVDIPGLIAQVSAHWQLVPGDLIYTGTPEGVGEIHPGDVLEISGDGLAGARWTIAPAS